MSATVSSNMQHWANVSLCKTTLGKAKFVVIKEFMTWLHTVKVTHRKTCFLCPVCQRWRENFAPAKKEWSPWPRRRCAWRQSWMPWPRSPTMPRGSWSTLAKSCLRKKGIAVKSGPGTAQALMMLRNVTYHWMIKRQGPSRQPDGGLIWLSSRTGSFSVVLHHFVTFHLVESCCRGPTSRARSHISLKSGCTKPLYSPLLPAAL